ncbi:hypothetical protein Vretimale_5914 [Volvox reticuliferus]|uniref:Uncharacterized protein n=1 Tax=Volvox reticuliferus TaxID=1737510 RepID=A0A8J4G6L5_9CHLO|nr:hypothetical protein Vretimale_5914 [Volvox reticuliferus]
MRFLSDIWRWVSQGLAAWAAQQHSDLWKLLMITYFISLGSYQLIKPFCLGESHALPEDSLLANVYPCNGSILYGAWVILSNPWAFWRDLAFVRLSEKWAAVETYFLLPRICCAVFLPRSTYELVAPVLAAVHRGLGPATLVIISFIEQQAPTTLAVWGMKTWPFMDIGFNAIFPTTPAVEVVYGILSLGWMVTLGLRYQHTHPDFQLHLPLRIVVCLASTSWLVLFQLYRRRLFVKRKLPFSEVLATAVSSSGPGVLKADGAGVSRLVTGVDQASNETSTYLIAGQVGTRTAVARIGTTGSNPTCTPAGVSGVHICSGHVQYNAFPGRYLSIHIKMGNAEVGQVREGYRTRIARVLKAAGLYLYELYIRQGCIDLTVDAWTASSEIGCGSTAADCEPDVDIGAIIRALHLNWNGEEDAINGVQLDTATNFTVMELGRTDMKSSESLCSSTSGSV